MEVKLKFVVLESIEHTMILTYDVGNPGPGLEQAQKCIWVKSVNENIFQQNILF
jgi:hypothetical protein